MRFPLAEATARWNCRSASLSRSLGIAFGGCTLPGAGHPLFTVPEGSMALGLGIHGEPGISAASLGSAADVADVLVDGVLAEEPERGGDGYAGRVAVLLNGLGATKYEELFVVCARVAERLGQAGLTVVEPEVGEHVTSLDMAGLYPTVTYLDAEKVAVVPGAPESRVLARPGRRAPAGRPGRWGVLHCPARSGPHARRA